MIKIIQRNFILRICIVPGIPGILTKTVEDQVIVFQPLMENFLQNAMDPSVAPIAWNDLVKQ